MTTKPARTTGETKVLRPTNRKLFGGLFASTIAPILLFTACGGDPAPIAAAPAAVVDDAAATTAVPGADPAAGPVAVTSGESDLGDILIGSQGLAVYGFLNDVDATSACYGTCAEAWPPVLVSEDWTVAPGLDSGIFNAVARDDGQLQLVAGKWPLYYFAGDTTPTDLNGQGSGEVWFAVGTDGVLITDDTAAAAVSPADTPTSDASIVAVATTSLGDALVDEAGLTLYGFLDDKDGVPSCEGACADAWPPAFVDSAELPAGLDADVYSVSERSDGTFQLNSGVWPLYRFAGDAAAGDVNGQGSGDVWFVAAPGGGLIQDGDSEESASAGVESEDDDY